MLNVQCLFSRGFCENSAHTAIKWRGILTFCVRKFKRVSYKGHHGIILKESGSTGGALLYKSSNLGGEMLKIRMELKLFANFSCKNSGI